MDTATNIPRDQTLLPDNLTTAPPIRPLWFVLFGILLMGLGSLAFVSIVTATIVSVYFVATTMVIAGAAEVSLGLRSKSQRRRWTWVVLGALYIGAGLFAFFNPLVAAGVLTLLLGTSLVGVGIVRLLLALQMRSNRRWWWVALSAAVTALLGIMVLAQWPASSLYILGVFLSVDLIFAGLCWAAIGIGSMSVSEATATSAP